MVNSLSIQDLGSISKAVD